MSTQEGFRPRRAMSDHLTQIEVEEQPERPRRSILSDAQLMSLLWVRLKNLRRTVSCIAGIDRQLQERGVQLPCRLPPMPDVDDAISDLLESGGDVETRLLRRRSRRTGNGQGVEASHG